MIGRIISHYRTVEKMGGGEPFFKRGPKARALKKLGH